MGNDKLNPIRRLGDGEMESKKYRIQVRNLDEYTMMRISEMAKEAGMTKEGYLRKVLQNFALSGEVKAAEDKYSSLVESLSQYIEMQGDIIEQNMLLIREIKEKLLDV